MDKTGIYRFKALSKVATSPPLAMMGANSSLGRFPCTAICQDI